MKSTSSVAGRHCAGTERTGRGRAGRVRILFLGAGVWGLCCLVLLGLSVGAVWAADELSLLDKMAERQTSVRGQQLPVAHLLTALGQQAGVNVIVDEAITETISLDLKDVNLRDAFQVVLEAKKLRAHERNKIILVELAETFELDQRNLVTERFCSRFGGLDTYLPELTLAKSDTGSISISADGNCLVVRDQQANVQRLKELLDELDQPLPQVHIKARIVTIEKSVLKKLGIEWGYTGTGRTVPDPGSLGRTDVSAAYAAGNMAFGLIRDNFSLDVDLSAMQENKQLRVLSAPRIVVLDGQEAEIKQGTEIPYETGTLENRD